MKTRNSTFPLPFRSYLLCILVVTVFVHSSVDASCSKPTLPSNSFTLTTDKGTYATNDTYEIYCVPGYSLSGNTELTCLSSGSWSTEPPTCSPAEGSYPWWMLLVAVTLTILLVACVLPRLIHCCISNRLKKKKGGDEKQLDEEDRDQFGDDYDDDDVREDSPVPDYPQNRVTNLEFMNKVYGNSKTLAKANENTTF